MIFVPPPLNDSVINTPQLSSVRQQSSISSHNTVPELQASSIRGRISPDPPNIIPPPSNKKVSHNIYGYTVDVSKLTPEQQQQHDVMLLHHYHELCNTNEPSSMFVSPTPIPSIESLSQSTISSLSSGSFGIKRADVHIRQLNKSELANTEKVMAITKR